jgi:hypothetical protein
LAWANIISSTSVGLRPACEDVEQVIDFVIGQRQAQRAVGGDQRSLAASQYIDGIERLRCEVAEQFAGGVEAGQHRFGHAVVQQAGRDLPFICGQGAATLDHNVEGDDALDALDGVEVAIPGDVGGLRRPRRNGADPWRNQKQLARVGTGLLFFEQRRQFGALVGSQGALLRHNMPVIGHHRLNIRDSRHQAGLQALQTEGGKGGVALEAKNIGHWRVVSG